MISARVGWAWRTIDSIIWVAVITQRLSSRERLMMCFCIPISAASPISIAKSPRATITASLARMIASRLASEATASAFSILVTMAQDAPLCRARVLAFSRSSAELVKEMAR